MPNVDLNHINQVNAFLDQRGASMGKEGKKTLSSKALIAIIVGAFAVALGVYLLCRFL